MTDVSATENPKSFQAGPLADKGRKIFSSMRDPRFTRLQRWSFVISLVLVWFALNRIPGLSWNNQLKHGWYHLFVAVWVGFATYKFRSVGTREMIRFWLAGFFPVALLTYILTEPLERLIGTGNFQTAIWVPLAEELIKVLPLVLWTTIARPRNRHGTLSDFWILGFAIGAGFSFHEDALYSRLVASGFGDGLMGKLFPMFLTGGQYVITHAGWTALAAVGVGIFSMYRTKVWAWVVGAALVAVPVFDHAAVNWRGSDLPRTLVGNGRVGAFLLLATVVLVVAHDRYMMNWTSQRDNLFPTPAVRGDLQLVTAGPITDRVSSLISRQRYRRLRNAVFCDLYRVRSRGKSAGDRRDVMKATNSLAKAAGVATNLRDSSTV